MNVAIVTGSCGLIGSEAVAFLSDKMDLIVGIDNNLRAFFFGKDASTEFMREAHARHNNKYLHKSIDIRAVNSLDEVFAKYTTDIKIVIHAAAQPSHDWAAKEPLTDFSINAVGTVNMLEMTRRYCPEATFIFTSTNKVYGDRPNTLPLIEQDTRYEVDIPSYEGVSESMRIDHCTHSVFGASKVAADIMVQEYGRYFGMNTGVFRGGCLTGPQHSGAKLHGFLSYLMKCAVHKEEYTIIGYKGKQVRDNIHSKDLINMFWHFHQNPHKGEVYNAGGGRFASISVLEAIEACEFISGNKMKVGYNSNPRTGDHQWYISDVSKFRNHYPDWDYTISLPDTMKQIFEAVKSRNS